MWQFQQNSSTLCQILKIDQIKCQISENIRDQEKANGMEAKKIISNINKTKTFYKEELKAKKPSVHLRRKMT